MHIASKCLLLVICPYWTHFVSVFYKVCFQFLIIFLLTHILGIDRTHLPPLTFLDFLFRLVYSLDLSIIVNTNSFSSVRVKLKKVASCFLKNSFDIYYSYIQYKRQCTYCLASTFWLDCRFKIGEINTSFSVVVINGTKYSRIYQVKFVEDSL